MHTSLVKQKNEYLLSAAVIIVCLALSLVFPIKNNVENFLRGIFFLIIVPALYVKLVLKKNLSDIGLNLKNKRSGFLWGSLALIISILATWILVEFTSFSKNFQVPLLAINNFWFFLAHILIFYNLLLFIQEYFFQGFIISILRERFLWGSIFIQTGIYFIIVIVRSDNPHTEIWQFVPFIILSLTGGITTYKTRSIIYSWASGLFFVLLLNTYLIYTLKNQ